MKDELRQPISEGQESLVAYCSTSDRVCKIVCSLAGNIDAEVMAPQGIASLGCQDDEDVVRGQPEARGYQPSSAWRVKQNYQDWNVLGLKR